jgi:hypothetical protein
VNKNMVHGQMRKTNIDCGDAFVQHTWLGLATRNQLKGVTLWQHNLMSKPPIDGIMQTIERYHGVWHVSC